MTVLELRTVGYAYEDGNVALTDISLRMEEGEKVAVVGPNGAGKSTLLHLIAGFRMPFQGDVLIRGRKLEKETADDIRKDLGLLFQDPDDQIFMPTVEEDVAFGPLNLKLEDIDGRVTRSLASTGVASLAKRRPYTLSHGEKKRVAIAGILAMDPKILLLDEPTSGLDPKARADFVQLLKGMRSTMLIATHDLEAAAEIADRVLVLKRKVICEGTVSEIVRRKDVLLEAGLEPPQISRLFESLSGMGYPVEAVPVSVEQAAAELARVVDREAKNRRKGKK